MKLRSTKLKKQLELTRENATVEDVERYDGSVLGRGEETRVIINTKVLLEPHNRCGRFIRCGIQTASASVPPVIGGEMIPSETVR